MEQMDVALYLACSALGVVTLGLAFTYQIMDVRVMKVPPMGRAFVGFVLTRYFPIEIHSSLIEKKHHPPHGTQMV